jgi:hypothetical protein
VLKRIFNGLQVPVRSGFMQGIGGDGALYPNLGTLIPGVSRY